MAALAVPWGSTRQLHERVVLASSVSAMRPAEASADDRPRRPRRAASPPAGGAAQRRGARRGRRAQTAAPQATPASDGREREVPRGALTDLGRQRGRHARRVDVEQRRRRERDAAPTTSSAQPRRTRPGHERQHDDARDSAGGERDAARLREQQQAAEQGRAGRAGGRDDGRVAARPPRGTATAPSRKKPPMPLM